MRVQDLIRNIVVVGDNHPYLVALIVGKNSSIGKEELCSVINDANKLLVEEERIKNIYLLDEELSVENGMLTKALKLDRKNIGETYKNIIDQLYVT